MPRHRVPGQPRPRRTGVRWPTPIMPAPYSHFERILMVLPEKITDQMTMPFDRAVRILSAARAIRRYKVDPTAVLAWYHEVMPNDLTGAQYDIQWAIRRSRRPF